MEVQNYFTPDVSRGTYDRIVSLLAKQTGLTVEQFTSQYKVMQSDLKLAAYLNPGLSSYSLSPRKGVNSPVVPNTVLLDFNDFFAISGVSLRIGKTDYASGVYSNAGNYPVLTYPDPSYFGGNGTSVGKEWTALQCLVNGTVSITVNNDAMMDPTTAQEFFYNPTASYTASPLEYPGFGGSEPKKGIYPMTPQIILDASADNQIILNLADGVKTNIDGAISTGTTDSGTRNIVYVILHGLKIKNLAGAGNAICGKV